MIVELLGYHIRGKPPLTGVRNERVDSGGFHTKRFSRTKARVRLWLKSASQNPRSPNDRMETVRVCNL